MENDPDVVYLVRPSSTNTELRYSLRSLKFLRHRRVWIFGGAPTWVRDVTVVQVPQLAGKHRAVTANLYAALQAPDMADRFYLFNDDFFALREVPDGWDSLWVTRGLTSHVIADMESRGLHLSSYATMMRSTDTLLRKRLELLGTWSYELHLPLPVDTALMLHALDDSGFEPGHHLFRSVYGNYAAMESGDPGKLIKDVKVYSRSEVPALDAMWASTSDIAFSRGRCGRFIQAMLPDPCGYEA